MKKLSSYPCEALSWVLCIVLCCMQLMLLSTHALADPINNIHPEADKEVYVKGSVFCEQCFDGSLGAINQLKAPLAGAQVMLQCNSSDGAGLGTSHTSVAVTNKKGSFELSVSSGYYHKNGAAGCWVRLLQSPDAKCPISTDMKLATDGYAVSDQHPRLSSKRKLIYMVGELPFKAEKPSAASCRRELVFSERKRQLLSLSARSKPQKNFRGSFPSHFDDKHLILSPFPPLILPPLPPLFKPPPFPFQLPPFPPLPTFPPFPFPLPPHHPFPGHPLPPSPPSPTFPPPIVYVPPPSPPAPTQPSPYYKPPVVPTNPPPSPPAPTQPSPYSKPPLPPVVPTKPPLPPLVPTKPPLPPLVPTKPPLPPLVPSKPPHPPSSHPLPPLPPHHPLPGFPPLPPHHPLPGFPPLPPHHPLPGFPPLPPHHPLPGFPPLPPHSPIVLPPFPHQPPPHSLPSPSIPKPLPPPSPTHGSTPAPSHPCPPSPPPYIH